MQATLTIEIQRKEVLFSAAYKSSRFESGQGLDPGAQDSFQRGRIIKDGLKVKEERQAMLANEVY